MGGHRGTGHVLEGALESRDARRQLAHLPTHHPRARVKRRPAARKRSATRRLPGGACTSSDASEVFSDISAVRSEETSTPPDSAAPSDWGKSALLRRAPQTVSGVRGPPGGRCSWQGSASSSGSGLRDGAWETSRGPCPLLACSPRISAAGRLAPPSARPSPKTAQTGEWLRARAVTAEARAAARAATSGRAQPPCRRNTRLSCPPDPAAIVLLASWSVRQAHVSLGMERVAPVPQG